MTHQCVELHRDDPDVQRLGGLGASALKYQRMGYRVLALGEGSKRPHHLFAAPAGSAGSAGVHWATTDPAMVEYVWSRDKLAGVGIAAGRGLVVIDLDTKQGEDGPGNFGRLLMDHPYLPIDAVTSTPSGGWHLYLRTPAGEAVPSRPGILPGVDIQGDDHYVVAPPSRVWVDSSEGSALLPYRQVSGCPCSLPMAPEWFLRWIEQAQSTGTDHGKTGEPLPAVEALMETGLERGSRNTSLHRLACSLFRRCGTTPKGQEAARMVIENVLASTDKAGFPRWEIERTISSALAFVRERERESEQTWQAMYGNRR